MVLKLGTFWKVDHTHLESFELWCWRRMEKIRLIDRVRKAEVRVLHRVKDEKNTLHTKIKWAANWIGYMSSRNCLLKYAIEETLEERIESTGRWERRRRQLLDNLKGKKWYWKLMEEALYRTVWITCFGRGYGPVVRQITELLTDWMNEWIKEQINKWRC